MKLLIITSVDIFKDNSSSSMTIRSFLGEIPRTNIFQIICSNSYSTNIINDRNTYILSQKDIILYPYRKTHTPYCSITQPIDNKISSAKSISFHILAFLRDILSILPYKIDNKLISFIKNANPDCIYTCSFTPRCYYLIDEISRRTNIPHIAHFFDDWPNIQYSGSILSKTLKLRFQKFLKKFIHKSPCTFCISELMCQEYTQKYEYHHFYPLMHSVDSLIGIPSERKRNGKIRMLYAGSMYLERYLSILEFCKCITLNNQANEYEITIYTHENHWQSLSYLYREYQFLKYGGFISHEELMEKISECDALLFVESLKEEYLEYTRLSMSTKIPEFLSSGKPIFAIGNNKQGSIAYLQKHNAAYVVDDLAKMKEVYNNFCTQHNMENIVQNAHKLYETYHTKTNQQQFFINTIINSIK